MLACGRRMEIPTAKPGSLTPAQQRAVDARGNVLVMAGAGTGKTKTLVERCLNCLDRERVALDELLIVTFTEAAAAEMRQRLRKKLEEKAAAHFADEHWPGQLALFDVAHIGTLHSFCLRLVREHFYELGLDPQFSVLDEGEARQCISETLDEQFQAHYAGDDAFSLAVQELVQIHGSGRDESIRQLVLQLHHYSQARPDAAGWLAAQTEVFSAADPVAWQGWLLDAIAHWHADWVFALGNLAAGNEKAAELAKIISPLKGNFPRETAAEILSQVLSADGNWPARRKTILRQPLERIFDEAAFLVSLAAVKNGGDPLAEDWSWVRGHMVTLLRLAAGFSEAFARRKLADGVLDFHDLEQFALRLLWDFNARRPTAVAEAWQAKLKFVFVDEYQDINAAQDKIIQALSREAGNRFLVGDVKQSIYRFRLADPKIFRDYAHAWRGQIGEVISLSENFRSHEGLLNFVNDVCRLVMREETGGVAYDADAELKPGRRWGGSAGEPGLAGGLAQATARRDAHPAGAEPRVELLLRCKAGRAGPSDEMDGELAGLDEAQKEARLIALRLKELVGKLALWDDEQKVFRTAEWRDMAILLRSPRGKSEIFVKEFERASIPLAVARGGFYQSAEILDLLSLLRLLDNPLQDVPCIAVLRSPIVGLSLDDLAEIRLVAKGHFWTALNRFHALAGDPATRHSPHQRRLSDKAGIFLERFARWRKRVKQNSLSQCLEEILDETLYADWLRAQSRGAQRAGNVAGLLNLAQQFDQFQRQGLFRFLKFIEAQQAAESEPEVAATPVENAVRLMSIHQSKGQEFGVVVLADMAKTFNEQDLRGDIIFDDELGLCPKVKPPSSGRRYPSLPHWLAQRRQKRELRGEELRLLYVALTRARDNLILTASITQKNWDEVWSQAGPATTQKIAEAGSFADWLALWFAQQAGNAGAASGENALLRWRLVEDGELIPVTGQTRGEPEFASGPEGARGRSWQPLVSLDAAAAEKLRGKLSWNYPFAAATERKAKSSVTALRREAEEKDDEAEPVFAPRSLTARKTGRGKLSAAEIGAAHHRFLQMVALDKTGELAAEAERLVRENYLSADECAVLDLPALTRFWAGDLGRRICANAALVRRELPFTAAFSPAELSGITGTPVEADLKNEFIVVQGVADLAVLLPEEIWLVDFKTDDVGPGGLPEKIKTYAPQLKLYGAALNKIFGRPVTLRALHFLSLGQTEMVEA